MRLVETSRRLRVAFIRQVFCSCPFQLQVPSVSSEAVIIPQGSCFLSLLSASTASWLDSTSAGGCRQAKERKKEKTKRSISPADTGENSKGERDAYSKIVKNFKMVTGL